MALLRYSDIKKMNKKDREGKLKELKFALVKANVTANKANAKPKEIKRAIARLLTFRNLQELQNAKDKPSTFNTFNKEVLKRTK